MALTNPGEAVLRSPLLPWNPAYKKVNFCVEFSYLLPASNSTSRLEVYSQSRSGLDKILLWAASGFHGTRWGRGRIPVKSEEAFKVWFTRIKLLVVSTDTKAAHDIFQRKE